MRDDYEELRQGTQGHLSGRCVEGKGDIETLRGGGARARVNHTIVLFSGLLSTARGLKTHTRVNTPYVTKV